MKTIIYTSLFFTLFVGKNLLSQQLPLGSQYYVNMYSFNPAEAGTSVLQSYFSHRSQFTGISSGPQTTYLSVDGPTKYDKMGLGLIAMTDRTDILSKNTFIVLVKDKDEDTEKANAARKLDIPLMTLSEFKIKYNFYD
jgi:hypothetical protein